MAKKDTKNYRVINIQPRDYKAINVNPKNKIVSGETVIFTDTRFFSVGMPMGLLLVLTYPVGGTWSNAVRQ